MSVLSYPRLAPHGASGLKGMERIVNSGDKGLAPHGASGLKADVKGELVPVPCV